MTIKASVCNSIVTLINHPWKSLSVAVMAGALFYYDPFGSDTVYKGTIDGDQVHYIEDKGLFGLLGQKNELRVSRGKESYRFIDSQDSHSINWQSNNSTNYLNDEIERFVIVRPGLRRNSAFDAEDRDGNATLKGQKAETYLRSGTEYFNTVRTKIKEAKLVEYLKTLQSTDEFFSRPESTE